MRVLRRQRGLVDMTKSRGPRTEPWGTPQEVHKDEKVVVYKSFIRPHLEGNWTTRGHANSRIANSRTGHLADWSTRGLDNSRTSQLADWTSRGLDNSRSRRCRQEGKLST